MGCIRPATPGFLVTLLATILLAVVSFCVPYFKSVYFLRADIEVGSNRGSITFGTLGYCLELANGTTCSKPSIGYQLDINSLVGNKFPVQIPQVAVKWLTYALFLHVIALILAAGSALFGLLAHVREMSMACCSTCISGFAAVITLIAFIFDIALFFVAKARINAVGRASIGNAIWLTLAAWLLLFFSGCFFMIGRCCISKRGPRSSWGKRESPEVGGPDNTYAERMRMDAIKAEADRKAKQQASGGGLPAFPEYQPLTARMDGDSVYTDTPYKESDSYAASASYGRVPTTGNVASGYAPAPHGSRAVDEYYSPSSMTPTAAVYPPRPTTQPPSDNQSIHSSYTPSAYPQVTPTTTPPPRQQPSGYATTASPPPPLPSNQYLVAGAYGQGTSGYQYGHTAGGSSYHTAASHQQQASASSQHAGPSFNPDIYNSTGVLHSSQPSAPNPYTYSTQTPPAQSYGASEPSYASGGGGYGANPVPQLREPSNYLYPTEPSYPVDGYAAPTHGGGSQTSPTGYLNDAPPGYEAGTPETHGQWGKH